MDTDQAQHRLSAIRAAAGGTTEKDPLTVALLRCRFAATGLQACEGL